MAEEPLLQDVAMSLCALAGRSHSASPDSRDDATKSCNQQSATPFRDVSAAHAGDGSATDPTSSLQPMSMNLQLENRLQISDPMPSLSTSAAIPTKKKAAPKKARAAPAKYNVKPKDPKRDTSVPFDEMKRLMRVYGSLKCLRNRTPVDSGRAAKVESVKRKFYRWFPDLDGRFVRTPEGWYRPKAGHEEEMRYREMMRKSDQESLVKKRNSRRSSSKPIAPPAV
eukprot:CAMPEP_0172307288 /NCGR_PEP_ID=MMETSP1058-20130122/8179_1 /TAXON_ID=83371 /ORGANISM="Detonula confervacea, Strain CCMP 353" /LENGTH=224 /DNA_ID=CAMNT_0013019419 /DNA_START=119 /DNA_END=793 /DNA_ORIENTATION=-